MKYRIKKPMPGLKVGEISDSKTFSFTVEFLEKEGFIEPVNERIELSFFGDINGTVDAVICKKDYSTIKSHELGLMEKAINGEMFTEDDIIELMGLIRATAEKNAKDLGSWREVFDNWLKTRS